LKIFCSCNEIWAKFVDLFYCKMNTTTVIGQGNNNVAKSKLICRIAFYTTKYFKCVDSDVLTLIATADGLQLRVPQRFIIAQQANVSSILSLPLPPVEDSGPTTSGNNHTVVRGTQQRAAHGPTFDAGNRTLIWAFSSKLTRWNLKESTRVGFQVGPEEPRYFPPENRIHYQNMVGGKNRDPPENDINYGERADNNGKRAARLEGGRKVLFMPKSAKNKQRIVNNSESRWRYWIRLLSTLIVNTVLQVCFLRFSRSICLTVMCNFSCIKQHLQKICSSFHFLRPHNKRVYYIEWFIKYVFK